MSQLTRQEIYDQIKASSKEEFILKEMQRLGYWTKAEQPSLATNFIQQKAQLQTQLSQLSQQIRDPQAALKAFASTTHGRSTAKTR